MNSNLGIFRRFDFDDDEIYIYETTSVYGFGHPFVVPVIEVIRSFAD